MVKHKMRDRLLNHGKRSPLIRQLIAMHILNVGHHGEIYTLALPQTTNSLREFIAYQGHADFSRLVCNNVRVSVVEGMSSIKAKQTVVFVAL